MSEYLIMHVSRAPYAHRMWQRQRTRHLAMELTGYIKFFLIIVIEAVVDVVLLIGKDRLVGQCVFAARGVGRAPHAPNAHRERAHQRQRHHRLHADITARPTHT